MESVHDSIMAAQQALIAAEWEQKGYDEFLNYWVENGCAPTASKCPARYMSSGPQRDAFLKGWRRAGEELRG